MPQEVVANPSKTFSSPKALLTSQDLNREEKVEALRNWSNELNQLLAAEEENMAGDSNTAEKLRDVDQALAELGADPPEHDAKA